ncbi:MAG: cation transporter [Sphingomonadales bacterium]|nr:MAG: cation transporter [Sphingomonadales bacterium]TNF05366.1 MAG: cation transporter [Sphingomonadales bacterium]
MAAEPYEQTHYFDHVYLPEGHDRNARRTHMVIALTLVTMVVEIAAGWITGSMALLADGFHMATHAGALAIAALAYSFARRHANNARFTFGTGKVGDLAGFASALMLGLASLAIAAESAQRLLNPGIVDFGDATLVAVVGLVVNLVSAWMLMDGGGHQHGHQHGHDHGHGHAHHGQDYAHGPRDNNLRAAYLHVLADALTSVAAIAALLAGRYLGWIWLDPLIGMAGAVIIARWAWGLMKDTAAILLDTAEPKLTQAIKAIAEDRGGHVADLHVWRVGPHAHAVIVTIAGQQGDTQAIRTAVGALGNVVHVTVERWPE